MQTCINVLVQIYTSAYFDMGLLMKALEITWAKPMYMQFIFPCGGGMHLLIAGFASIGYLYDTGPRRAVSNVSGYRCESDCRSRGCKFDPGPVPYFHGDWSWNNFYGHSAPFCWIIHEGLLKVSSESMCTNNWLTACSSLLRKECGSVNWLSRHDHSCWLGM